MKKILISTGGSGGHVVPATILYEHLSSSYDVQIASDYRGSKFIDKNFYKCSVIEAPKISNNIFFAPLFLILFTISIIKSFKFLKQNNIHYLISTGGYMSLPFCIAAKLLNLCNDDVRLPLVRLTQKTKDEVKKALKFADLL